MPHRKAPPVKHDDPEMIGFRARNATGELRRKRGDTRVDTIEQQYHVDFSVRGDMQLETLRQVFAENEISKLLAKAKK